MNTLQHASLGRRTLATAFDFGIFGVVGFLFFQLSTSLTSTVYDTLAYYTPPIATLTLLSLIVLELLILTRHGQTLGKKLFGLKVVLIDGRDGTFRDLVLKRNGLPLSILFLFLVGFLLFFFGLVGPGAMIYPLLILISSFLIYSLIDMAFLIRKDRRCLHDVLGNTVVIKV